MQIRPEDFAPLANLIKNSKKILIIAGTDPAVDVLAAGLCLEETFLAVGKNVQIFASGVIPEVLKNYSEKINNRLEVKKLVVSFNWRKNEVEKVSYKL